jgi:hypothetical protein
MANILLSGDRLLHEVSSGGLLKSVVEWWQQKREERANIIARLHLGIAPQGFPSIISPARSTGGKIDGASRKKSSDRI